ncbi:MAG: exo-alpha-sialidase [Candidatus Hydrogenedentes bacterium]|nr:exo-alpha-sialidase [Candidatus Hydrogenedentota bacterium]
MPDPTEFLSKVSANGGRADFVFGDDRPFPECHASTLAEAANGDLLCSWFGGTKEGTPDVGIWLSRFHDAAWTAPTQVAKVNDTAHWNPVLFRDPKRGLYLFFKVGPKIEFWQTYWMRSHDDGRTWTLPCELVPGDQGGRGPVRSKPIILSDGAWLAPASTEYKHWDPFADRSEDGGLTWTRSAIFEIERKADDGKGAIQPTLWESSPGNVHALLRTTWGRIARTDSADYGKTWTPVYTTELPNNNSGIDALRLDDGRVLLVYNPVGANWGERTPLDLAVSTDNGESWRDVASLETEKHKGFSYPAIIRTAKGIAISYTWKRERIRVWQIPLNALAE